MARALHHANMNEKPGKSDGGSAFKQFGQASLIGNPGDPLIGFPFILLVAVSRSRLPDADLGVRGLRRKIQRYCQRSPAHGLLEREFLPDSKGRLQKGLMSLLWAPSSVTLVMTRPLPAEQIVLPRNRPQTVHHEFRPDPRDGETTSAILATLAGWFRARAGREKLHRSA
jgi:hypothetical protein